MTNIKDTNLDDLYYMYDYPCATKKRVRAQRKAAKSHRRFWCGGCDANLVHADEKCQVCGYVHSKGVLKKQDTYVNNDVK